MSMLAVGPWGPRRIADLRLLALREIYHSWRIWMTQVVVAVVAWELDNRVRSRVEAEGV